jgi:hypothetical protein
LLRLGYFPAKAAALNTQVPRRSDFQEAAAPLCWPPAICRHCGRAASGLPNTIVVYLEAPVIAKILKHLGLQARAPPRSPARGQALQVA